ncbi:hypothetical protein LLEC1_03649 [Akanthomyces lecanii]|uniref:Uncharacterized protein n=1 Tax=Cordyceps confragosa TaxID=2714763 RepID=A0A179II01_CORDF|nr:hypothetical protein LLEC1_03649 [Akanthomyces lecanii]
MESVRRRSVSFADNAKRELVTLTRRVTASAPVDAAASGQDTKSGPESGRFQPVPSANRETTTQEQVQDDHEDAKPALSGNAASHDEIGQIVMI